MTPAQQDLAPPPPPPPQQQQQQQQRSQTPQPASPSRAETPPRAASAVAGAAPRAAPGTAPAAPGRVPSTAKPRGEAAQARSEVSASAYKLLSLEMIRVCDAQNDLGKLEMLGFGIGHRFVERFTKRHAKFNDTLEVVKFLCKVLWNAMFGKTVDKLQTNHKGVFVLHDNNFSWVRNVDVDYHEEESLEEAKKLLIVPCGLIRGALSNLGIKCTVRAEFSTLPMCFFNIQINANLL